MRVSSGKALAYVRPVESSVQNTIIAIEAGAILTSAPTSSTFMHRFPALIVPNMESSR